MSAEHVDVVIIGAGLSGIGAACHLSRNTPSKSYAILESRSAMGVPGICFAILGFDQTQICILLGIALNPGNMKAIADGPAILSYIHETAQQYDIEQHIRYNQRVELISWDSASATWTLLLKVSGQKIP